MTIWRLEGKSSDAEDYTYEDHCDESEALARYIFFLGVFDESASMREITQDEIKLELKNLEELINGGVNIYYKEDSVIYKELCRTRAIYKDHLNG